MKLITFYVKDKHNTTIQLCRYNVWVLY